MKDRSRLTALIAVTALALVWFLPNLSFVVAQDSGSVPVTSTTTTSTTIQTTTTTTSSTTTTTTPPTTVTTLLQAILLQLNTAVAAPGDPVGGSGQAEPNSTVGLTFFSHPTFLGNVTTDANGNFAFEFNVPYDAHIGPHTVEAVSASGARGRAPLNVVAAAPTALGTGYPLPILPYAPTAPVVAPAAPPAIPTAPASSSTAGQPAYTGVNVLGLTVLAAAALALGGMALTFGRLQPLIVIPGRNRRRPQWSHRRPRRALALPAIRGLDRADAVQIAVCVALAVALGLSLARQ